MQIKSVYKDGERIPAKYANVGVAGGQNLSPSFEWQDTPQGTKSFALAMVDHHPVAREFVHWLVTNILADVTSIDEGASGTDRMPAGSKELNTTYGISKYGGPRPPAGTGDHPYETTLYALNVEKLDLGRAGSPSMPQLDEFLKATEGKVLAKASLVGIFSQP